MISPADTITLALTTSTVPMPQQYHAIGSLQGRRVINTTDKINALKAKFNQIIESDNARTIMGYKWSTVVEILGSAALSGAIILYMRYNNIYMLMCGSVISLSATAYRVNNAKIDKLSQNLNNEDFVNWAESKRVELNFSNIEEYSNEFGNISY